MSLPKLAVRPSAVHGSGVFADQPLHQGEYYQMDSGADILRAPTTLAGEKKKARDGVSTCWPLVREVLTLQSADQAPEWFSKISRNAAFARKQLQNKKDRAIRRKLEKEFPTCDVKDVFAACVTNFFEMPSSGTQGVATLGPISSFLNHGDAPNVASCALCEEGGALEYGWVQALCDVECGTELCIQYPESYAALM